MRVVAIVFVALAVAATAIAATAPATTYKLAIAKARAQQSVHSVSTGVLGGNTTTFTADAAHDRGVQNVEFGFGGRTGHLVVRVVANVAYVRGDAFTLHGYLGLPQVDASRFAGKWFSLKPPSSAYKAVSAGVRFVSFVDELKMSSPYTAVSHGVKGSTTGLGQTRSPATLLVGADGLPTRETIGSKATGVVTTTTSRWNEKVNVTVPAGAIPFP